MAVLIGGRQTERDRYENQRDRPVGSGVVDRRNRTGDDWAHFVVGVRVGADVAFQRQGATMSTANAQAQLRSEAE